MFPRSMGLGSLPFGRASKPGRFDLKIKKWLIVGQAVKWDLPSGPRLPGTRSPSVLREGGLRGQFLFFPKVCVGEGGVAPLCCSSHCATEPSDRKDCKTGGRAVLG